MAKENSKVFLFIPSHTIPSSTLQMVASINGFCQNHSEYVYAYTICT